MIQVDAFAARLGLTELVDILAGRIDGPLEADVLQEAIEGALDAATDDLAQAAKAGVARIEMAIDTATRLINGYVASRYSSGLSQAEIDASPLPDIAFYLVKYDLMLNADEDTRLNYQNAMKMLKDISTGVLSLGMSDPAVAPQVKMATGNSTSKFDLDAFGL